MSTIEISELAKTHKNICSKFVQYEKKTGNYKTYLHGLELNKGYIHEYVDINRFKKNEKKIPSGYNKKSMNKKRKLRFYCDDNKPLLKPDNSQFKEIESKMKGYKKYFIHDNGSRPFLVYLDKDSAYVYRIPENIYFHNEDYVSNKQHHLYIEPIADFKTIKNFVGKSPLTESTSFSAGYGPRFDGNSILLKTGENKYVYIGYEIYEFKIPDDDEITKYYSPVGNSDVPYPVAFGKKNMYFMLDKDYVPMKYFKDLELEEKIDAYSYYYGHEGDEELSEYAVKMPEVKMLYNRID